MIIRRDLIDSVTELKAIVRSKQVTIQHTPEILEKHPGTSFSIFTSLELKKPGMASKYFSSVSVVVARSFDSCFLTVAIAVVITNVGPVQGLPSPALVHHI
jgi:hypothetical protein